MYFKILQINRMNVIYVRSKSTSRNNLKIHHHNKLLYITNITENIEYLQ